MSDDAPVVRRDDNTTVPLDRVPFTWKTLYAISKTEFVPRALRGKPNALLAAVLTGREMGLGPMESMRSIDVIDGRPSPSVEWMVGRILEAGHLIWPSEQTEESCTVNGVRFVQTPDGEWTTIEQSFTFTMKMAERVKIRKRDGGSTTLAAKDNWRNYPEAMLYWRAASQLARQLFPDILRSVKHNPEELGAEVHPYGVFVEGDLPDVPDDLELPADEDPIVDEETGEVIDIDEVAEITPVEHWSAEATGQADETAIKRVMQYAEVDDLWVDLVTSLGTYEDWIENRMEDIEAEVRFIFRAMERLGIWQGENTLRTELKRAGKEHLSEYKKAGLQSFARNVVMKAQVATREGTTDGD